MLGDSLSDQGNLLFATTQLAPTISPTPPVQPDPLRYFEGRFSNGPVYTEALAKDLGVSITPSQLGGTNFAFGGARLDYNTVEKPSVGGTQVYPEDAFPWTLQDQITAFNDYAKAHGADPNALYVVFSGSNDVTDIATRGKPRNATIANAVAGLIAAVDAFKAAGAKTVLVPDLPDIGTTPQARAFEIAHPGISAFATSLAQQFNTELAVNLDAETGIDIIRFDTFGFLDDVINNPAKYGFSQFDDGLLFGVRGAQPDCDCMFQPGPVCVLGPGASDDGVPHAARGRDVRGGGDAGAGVARGVGRGLGGVGGVAAAASAGLSSAVSENARARSASAGSRSFRRRSRTAWRRAAAALSDSR